jgi:hypothetical protein
MEARRVIGIAIDLIRVDDCRPGHDGKLSKFFLKKNKTKSIMEYFLRTKREQRKGLG